MDLETVRKERYSWEKNDCTVVALAVAALAVVDGQILDLVKTNPSAVIKSVWKLVNWKLEG